MKITVDFLAKPVLKIINDSPHFFDIVIDMDNQGLNSFFDMDKMRDKFNLITRIGDNYHGAKGVLIKNYNMSWNNNITMMNLKGEYIAYPFICIRQGNYQ